VADGVHHPEEEPAPPAGEAIHLPAPSFLPVLTAFGISLALVGIVLSLAITAIGAVIAIVAIVLWIRNVRQEMSELPLEH
jgi:hypothetical protein